MIDSASFSSQRRTTTPSRYLRDALVAAVVFGCGCGAAPQRRVESPLRPPAADASRLRARAAAGRPGAAPAPRARPDDTSARAATHHGAAPSADGVPPVSRAALTRLATYSHSLNNAARRDRAMERTMRTYMLVTREIFRRLRSAGTGKASTASYDPTPAWRFQGQVQRDLRLLADRAGVIDRHLDLLARSGAGIPQSGAFAQRIALFRSIFQCIRRDAWSRASHGKAWTTRVSAATKTPFDGTARARLYRQELQMMRTSVHCSTLIGSRRATD